MAKSHSTVLAHHFDSIEQQREASSLGMWIFLVTEIMFFGGLFTGYVVYRTIYPGVFAEGSHHLDITLGGINTVVLITSSLTMALAVRSAQMSNRKSLVIFLILTILLGLTFLGIKLVEYGHKFRDHLVPGFGFSYPGPEAGHVELFFVFYFFMTGLHALHMVAGVGVLTILLILAGRGLFSAEYYTPVELAGLYWHFVDIIWIFLFPLLYLIGLHLKGS
ncbi:MAG TPA: cytochrome c oxidase subunit 3 family protein [Candidatus Limnocylindrales bacterium]|nr:cytochrome c oxidase subunit 3 family protein [Candidatus Limnocylindrales bacterium]